MGFCINLVVSRYHYRLGLVHFPLIYLRLQCSSGEFRGRELSETWKQLNHFFFLSSIGGDASLEEVATLPSTYSVARVM